MKPYAPFKGKAKQFPKESHYELQFRRRGISTAIALRTIASAILNPGDNIPIQDHIQTRKGNEFLMNTILGIINDLDLLGFSFNRAKMTMKFHIDMTVD